jgi:uncharacterized protein (TIRG00374 family)
MRNFIFAIILLLGFIFIIGRIAEVQSIVETLRAGDWRFLGIALLLEFCWVFVVAGTYRAIFQILDLKEKISRLVLLSLAANFVNIVAPTAGLGGVAIFISESKHSGNSTGRITVASVLYVLYDYAALLCVLTLGLVVLFRRNDLTMADILASLILLIMAISLAAMLYLGSRSVEKLGKILAALARLVNRILWPFMHRCYLQEDRAYSFAHEVADGFEELKKAPHNLLSPAIFALLNKLLLITILFTAFLAFDVPYSVGTIIAAFSIAYLFVIVSPTPSGIGIVEGVLTLTLRSFNLPLGASAVVALAFRGITFWLPLLLGFIAFRLLDKKKISTLPA